MTKDIAAALVAQAPDPIVFADVEGIIRTWNDAACRVFGYTADEAIGQSLDLIIPERFREAHWRGFHRAIEERSTKYAGQALATRSARKDGTRIYVALSFSVLTDADGQVLGVSSHARDITEQFEKERA